MDNATNKWIKKITNSIVNAISLGITNGLSQEYLEQRKYEYQADIFLIFEEIEERWGDLNRIQECVETFETETKKESGKDEISAEERFNSIKKLQIELKKIKPEGGFEHYKKCKSLFIRKDLNSKLYINNSKQIFSLQNLGTELEQLKKQMKSIDDDIQKMFRAMDSPNYFFKSKDKNFDEVPEIAYKKIARGESFDSINEKVIGLLKFEIDDSFLKLCENFKKDIGVCTELIDNSEYLESLKLEHDNCFIYTQGKSGYCWLMSTLHCISLFVKKTQNIDVKFDGGYLIFYDKLEKAESFLDSIIFNLTKEVTDTANSYILNHAMTDKGQWIMAVNLIKKYGLVKTKIINPISNTSELNSVLSYLLRIYAIKIRRANDKGESKENIITIKQEAMIKIRNLLVSYLGEHTYNIESQGEYFRNLVKFPLDDYVGIYANDDKPYIEYEIEYNKTKFIGVPNAIFEKLIEKQIEIDGFCWITCDAGKFNIKGKHLFDDTSINLSTIIGNDLSIDRCDVLKYHVGHMSHAMVLYDFFVNSNGKKTYVAYDSGYSVDSGSECIMTESWLTKYLFQGVIRKSIFAENITHEIKHEKIKPWEFFGV